ncbi:leucine-rich repeat-containing protein 37A isoform 2-T3 [Glossophaga mutica]
MATWCVLCSLLGASLPSLRCPRSKRHSDICWLPRCHWAVWPSADKKLSRLLVKLLSEQEEVKVSKEEPGTSQWKNESYKTKKREATREQDAQESSELATQLPEHGYNSKLVVAIPVIVGAITSTVIFCFIAIYCHRTPSKEGKDGSSRGFFSILWHTRCSPEHTIKEDVSSRRQPLWLRDLYRPRSASCIEGMAQKLRDKDSSAEDELYYQMLRGEFSVLRVAATDSAA